MQFKNRRSGAHHDTKENNGLGATLFGCVGISDRQFELAQPLGLRLLAHVLAEVPAHRSHPLADCTRKIILLFGRQAPRVLASELLQRTLHRDGCETQVVLDALHLRKRFFELLQGLDVQAWAVVCDLHRCRHVLLEYGEQVL